MKKVQPKVLLTRNFPEVASRMLETADFDVTVYQEYYPPSKEQLIEIAQHYDSILCVAGDEIDSDFLHACSHLKVISQFAAGYDNIDLQTASHLGIAIANTPGAMSDATADMAFALMLAVARNVVHMHKRIRNDLIGPFQPTANLGVELKGKTLGVFGLGKIGMEMAKRCRGAYDMNVIYYNRSHNAEAEQELQARKVDFETLLRESDVISVHCALTPETERVFNQDAFKQMKSSAIFINTSRGKVHNESDLIEALRSKVIWGAGLDVTNPEPMHADNPLLQMDHVVVTPHIGSATVDARNEMARMAAENIIGYYQNNKVPYLVNEGVELK